MMSKSKSARSKPVTTPEGRLSFPRLDKPHTEGQYPSGKYQTEIIIPEKGNEKWIEDVFTICEKVAKEKWGASVNMDTVDMPLRHGAERDLEKYPMYRDGYTLVAKSKNKPGIVDGVRNRLEADADTIYGGVYARLSVTFYTYTAGRNKGIAVALNAVQKTRDGESFSDGAAKPAEELFDDYEEDIPFGTDEELMEDV